MPPSKEKRIDDTSPQLLGRTFAVLSLFTPERPQWTTTEIGRECNIPIPTVHRIMAALHRHQFVARDQMTKRFRLGPTALELGRSARASTDLRAVSLPVLHRLSAQSEETSLLTVLNDTRDRSVCLERVESSQPLRLSVEPGRSLPLHAGASQKALLAFMPSKEIEQVLEGPLEKLCAATIVDPDKLRGELQTIRERGWATSFEETNVGVCGLAMTLLNDDGRAVAAVGLAGPRARVPTTQISVWLAALRVSIEELAARLALTTSMPKERSRAAQGRESITAKGRNGPT